MTCQLQTRRDWFGRVRLEGVRGEVDEEGSGAGAAAGTVDGDVVMEDGG